MRSAVPEKILKIIDDLAADGNVPLTRLTVLKKWFERPGRLAAFGLWVARRASGRPGKTKSEFKAILSDVRALLGPASTRESYFQPIDRPAAELLHTRAAAAQNEFKKQEWGPVRVIHCWPLLLVEEGLAIYLWNTESPTHGYKLAADWAQNYDPRHGNGLNGPGSLLKKSGSSVCERGGCNDEARRLSISAAICDGGATKPERPPRRKMDRRNSSTDSLSHGKLNELGRFMFAIEALEIEN